MTKNSFSIMPRVLAHFGDELIRNEIIALTELVKNAYDAGAKKCDVIFYFKRPRNREDKISYKPFRIDIVDTGSGMSEETIKEHWLTVGTDNKRKLIEEMETEDNCSIEQKFDENQPLQRVPLGEKGIGRFGVHKLGQLVILDTKKEHCNAKRLIIDWNRLDGAKTLSDFDFDITESRALFPENKGTHLTILNIKGEDKDWTRAKLRRIYRALTALNIKFDRADCKLIDNKAVAHLLKFTKASGTSDQFNVKVIPRYNRSVFRGLKNFESIKDSALYECDILISDNQIKDFEYNFNPWSSIEKKFPPHSIAFSDLKSIEKLLQKPSDNSGPEDEKEMIEGLAPKHEVVDLSKSKIGNIYVKLYAFEQTPSVRQQLDSKKDVIDFLKQSSGIRVYRDGMRVYDYGEKGNDWLGLVKIGDIGSQLRSEHVVGYVFIDRKSSRGLVEKTNREGFIENKEYELFVYALKWAINYTFRLRRNSDKEALSIYYSKTAEPVISLLEDTKKYIDKHITNDKHKKNLTSYVYRIQKEYTDIVDTLYHSAGIGRLSSSIIHEIEKLIKEINLQIKSSSESNKARILVRRLDSTIKKFSFLIKRTDIKKSSVEFIIDQTLLFIELRLDNHSIEVTTDLGDENFQCYASITHATNVLLNLLDNSIYWLNLKGEFKKQIKLCATNSYEDGYVSLIVADNGPGFSREPEHLIRPFVSTKPYSIGCGLGLYIANELMDGMKGALKFPEYYDVEDIIDDEAFKEGAIVVLNFKEVS
ncbi:ATP-binding protein [Pseudodesulfovibrio tunisiensis]|uniref:ATP-binding protein n=1 Tax=Pseudodesulfovibrio tunisiensis TaxID=463192 RepID=UPI001FB52E29|nr:ATP-binding protein [Pseudodesulfovibrio tunisiensis]